MSDLQKARWIDHAFHAVLVLLVGLWFLYPPQRIGDVPQKPPQAREAAVPVKPWGLP
jgi:hypothetical protein